MKNKLKKLAEITSKDKERKNLSKILLKPDGTATATDSFILAELKTDIKIEDKAVLLDSKKIKKEIAKETDDLTAFIDGELTAKDYPYYQAIIPTSKPKASIKLDPALLIKLLKVFSDYNGDGKNNGIYIEIREKNQPIIIKTDTEDFGLIMPLYENK